MRPCAWMAGVALVAVTVWPAAADPDAPLPLLSRIKAIRALSQDEGARGYPVRIRGTITHFNEEQPAGLIIHDGESGQFLHPLAPPLLEVWRGLRRGDVIEVDGYTVRGGFAPNVQPERVRRIGRGPMPVPKRLSYASLITGRHDCDYVEITGVVQRMWPSSDPRINIVFAEIATEGGIVRAGFWDHEPDDARRLVDARVRLQGNVGALFSATEQLRGVSFFGERTRDIEVLDPPPDPLSLPVRQVRSLYHYSPHGEVDRRVRVRGVVIGLLPGYPVDVQDVTTTTTFRFLRHVVYVSDGTSGAHVETEQELRVRPGDVVEVTGFPTLTPAKPILKNAVLRTVGREGEPAPLPVTPPALPTPEFDAELVRIEGELLSVLSAAPHRVLVMRTGETVFDAALDASLGAGAFHGLRPGSHLSITGVYSYRPGPPSSFRVFLRSPGDVALVAASPWWTLGHTGVMLAILALVASGGVVWARAMARRKRQEYQAVLTERSRVARELHDTLEQGLAGISLQLEAVAGSLEASPITARHSLNVARRMLRYSLDEARRSVLDLRSQALESRDLAGALSDLARQMTGGTRLRAGLRVEGAARPLDASHEHHLLRIGTEALTNAIKHADATRIDITLRFTPEATELIVADDGRGLREETSAAGGRFGLQGMRERADKLGAVLRIEAPAAGGTRVAVTVPLADRAPQPAYMPAAGASWLRS